VREYGGYDWKRNCFISKKKGRKRKRGNKNAFVSQTLKKNSTPRHGGKRGSAMVKMKMAMILKRTEKKKKDKYEKSFL